LGFDNRWIAGVIIIKLEGRVWKVKGKLDPKFSNNQVEYDAMITKLKILVDMVKDYDYVQVMSDSQLANKLLHMFAYAIVLHVCCGENGEANVSAQQASRYKETPAKL
jgi:hypothetical protein